ncbi:DUF6712 family protein [Sunxiuqinia sp. sy24]|uniref:DUF6712 family protein n=1 Tax=Sunxiuqinia sp. sy24 TaxID=3461495 RepID=UPI004045FCD6
MLFKDIQEVKTYLAVGVGNDFNRLKAHIQNAENAYMRPLLHSNMYDELQEFYDEGLPLPETPSDAQLAMNELLAKVQNSVIHLAYWMGFQALNSTISDQGFRRQESDASKSLYKYQEDELKDYFKTSGFNAMDDILEYLENNIAHFAEFKATENWTIRKEAFIPDTKAFEKVPYSLNNSRLTFLRLVTHMQTVEDLQLKPLLGSAVFDELKAEMIKDSPSAKVRAILPHIRKPIVWFATAYLMEESGADLTEKGLYFDSFSVQEKSNLNRGPASEQRIASMIARNRMIGERYMGLLKNYLLNHVEEWPGFEAQDGFILNRDNTDKKTFWA